MLHECARPKQKIMYSFGLAHPYSILGADPRLGKCMAAIGIRKKHDANCLVICPAYLVPNWKKEIKKWSNDSVTTFTEGRKIYDVCDSDFVVISYDLVQKAEFLFEWADMVVLDEIHHLAHMNAKRTQFIHRCVYENSPKYLFGLTGTPIKNRVKEFYSLLALAYYDPRQKDHSFLETYPDEITFAERFSHSESYEVEVKGGRFITVTNYYGLKNVDELKTWLKGKYIRIRADKDDLPPLSFIETLVQDIDDSKLLEAFKNYFISDKEAYSRSSTFNEGRRNRTSSVLPEHKRNAAIKKVPFTIKYVENLMQSVDCCLVYSDHREPCQQLAKHFNVPAITGEMTGKRRAALVNDFQEGKLNMLCATIGALKEGADLYRAKDLVLNDLPWVVGDIDQVCARTRKIGEKEPRTVHLIFGSPQDEKIWEALNEKRETIDKAT